jgi:hypothetical protein
MSTPQTPTRRLADTLLDGRLDEFVTSRRAEGRPWRLICRDLRDATDGAIDITEVTIRSWFPPAPSAPAQTSPRKQRKAPATATGP